MTIKEFVLTIEDKNGYTKDVNVMATDISSAVKSMVFGNRFKNNGSMVVGVRENLTGVVDTKIEEDTNG